jgi:hypothetical protein
MGRKVSRIISACILALVLIAVLMALDPPSATLVPVSAEEANCFDEEIQPLEQGTQDGTARTAHISEGELTSKLQQGLDGIPAERGAVVLKAASVHLEGGGFVGVFTLDAPGKDLYLTMTGTLAEVNGMLQIQPSSAHLGRLPIPATVFRHILQRQFDTPETRERLRLPDFIKGVHIENGELQVEGR